MNELDKIKILTIEERRKIIIKYGNSIGKCIEASDELADKISKKLPNVKAKSIQVFVLYEYFENCLDYCYEEHWIVKVLFHGYPYFIDVTMDQFQWAFTRELPTIYFNRELPKFYLYKEPSKAILNKCGWNDWYNTGNYINNFNYWD